MRISRVISGYIRPGNESKKAASNVPVATPKAANIRETPLSVKATLYPPIKPIQASANMAMARKSAINVLALAAQKMAVCEADALDVFVR